MVSPEVAKASAARHALTMATELGWTHIQLEGDCMVVVNALNDRSGECLRSFGAVIKACHDVISHFDVFSCSFIRRTGNCLAHALSHFPLADFGSLEGVSPPADLAHLV